LHSPTVCNTIPNPNRGAVQCSDSRHPANSTCGIYCEAGYQPAGVSVAKCLWDDVVFEHSWDVDTSRFACVESVNIIIGGMASDHQYLTSAEVISPNHESDCERAKVADFPYPVMGAAGGMVNGIGIVCGGAMDDYDNCTNIGGEIGK
jgi:hypothetical protein